MKLDLLLHFNSKTWVAGELCTTNSWKIKCTRQFSIDPTACQRTVTERGQERHPSFQPRAGTLQEIFHVWITTYLCTCAYTLSYNKYGLNLKANDPLVNTWKESSLWQSSTIEFSLTALQDGLHAPQRRAIWHSQNLPEELLRVLTHHSLRKTCHNRTKSCKAWC